MRVDPSRFEVVLRRRRWKVALLLVGGGLTAIIAGFFTLVGGVGLLAPLGPDDQIIGALVLAVGGVIPGIVALSALGLGARTLRRLGRLERVVIALGRDPAQHPGSLAQVVGLEPREVKRITTDALVEGVLFREPVTPTAAEVDRQPPSSGVRARDQLELAERATEAALPPASNQAPADDLSEWGRPSTSLVGRVFNDTYLLEEQLGSGAMGAVYRARHRRTGRQYAVKTLLPSRRCSEEAIRRFEREAAAASSLGHRGIVTVHDFDQTDDGVTYLVTELLQGETVEARLRREGGLRWSEAAEIVVQVGEALVAAHSAGILHRDIKPGNIFLTRDPGSSPRAVLLDFGLAKQIDEAVGTKITTTGTVVGTPLYMAPEQACSERLDARCDVYALGAVLYELLVGEPPFVSDTIAGVYSLLLHEPHRPPSQASVHPVHPDVDDLMDRALAKDPEERFQTVRALVVAVSEVCRKAREDSARGPLLEAG